MDYLNIYAEIFKNTNVIPEHMSLESICYQRIIDRYRGNGSKGDIDSCMKQVDDDFAKSLKYVRFGTILTGLNIISIPFNSIEGDGTLSQIVNESVGPLICAGGAAGITFYNVYRSKLLALYDLKIKTGIQGKIYQGEVAQMVQRGRVAHDAAIGVVFAAAITIGYLAGGLPGLLVTSAAAVLASSYVSKPITKGMYDAWYDLLVDKNQKVSFPVQNIL